MGELSHGVGKGDAVSEDVGVARFAQNLRAQGAAANAACFDPLALIRLCEDHRRRGWAAHAAMTGTVRARMVNLNATKPLALGAGRTSSARCVR